MATCLKHGGARMPCAGTTRVFLGERHNKDMKGRQWIQSELISYIWNSTRESEHPLVSKNMRCVSLGDETSDETRSG